MTSFPKEDKRNSDDGSDTLKSCLADMFLSIVVNYDDDERDRNEIESEVIDNMNVATATNDESGELRHDVSTRNHTRDTEPRKPSNDRFHPLAVQNVFEMGKKDLNKADIVKVRKNVRSRLKREDRFQDAIYAHHIKAEELLEEEIKQLTLDNDTNAEYVWSVDEFRRLSNL